MAIENIDWPAAVTLLGAVGIIANTLYRMSRKDHSWKEPISQIEIRMGRIEEQIKNIESKITQDKQNSSMRETMLIERVDKAEKKIEKLTDTMITYISDSRDRNRDRDK